MGHRLGMTIKALGPIAPLQDELRWFIPALSFLFKPGTPAAQQFSH